MSFQGGARKWACPSSVHTEGELETEPTRLGCHNNLKLVI